MYTLSLYALYADLTVTAPPENLSVIRYAVVIAERLEGNAVSALGHSYPVSLYDRCATRIGG